MKKLETLANFITDVRLVSACESLFIAGKEKDYWDMVLLAGRHLETRLREKANLPSSVHGIAVVDKCFKVKGGILTPTVCKDLAEAEGFYFILRGIIQFHRNDKGHNEGRMDKNRALQIVGYVDYLLQIVESSKFN